LHCSAFRLIVALPNQAGAWGDDGHKMLALIAEHYLTPITRDR
jgi:hypothetical protein